MSLFRRNEPETWSLIAYLVARTRDSDKGVTLNRTKLVKLLYLVEVDRVASGRPAGAWSRSFDSAWALKARLSRRCSAWPARALGGGSLLGCGALGRGLRGDGHLRRGAAASCEGR